jgi:hypothetical protein
LFIVPLSREDRQRWRRPKTPGHSTGVNTNGHM